MTEGKRPDGYVPEELLAEIRKKRLGDLMYGRSSTAYIQWLLRGEEGEPYNPETIIGLFPTIKPDGSGGISVDSLSTGVLDDETETGYFADIAGIVLPDREVARELGSFQGRVSVGDEILSGMIPTMLDRYMASAAVVFSRPSREDGKPSMYLLSPLVVPPSATLRHLQHMTTGAIPEIR